MYPRPPRRASGNARPRAALIHRKEGVAPPELSSSPGAAARGLQGKDGMSHVPNEIAEVLGVSAAALKGIARANRHRHNHILRLTEQYCAVNRSIHRAETDVDPVSDEALRDMKKCRLALLDELRATIAGTMTV
jgi:uncharacterized protein YdcH (DUF465 family)